jgi:hypothetical protein
MNDNELISVVKESVTDVHMNVPEEQIMSRSRALRARRQIPALAVALTGAAAALAVTALLPASHQPDARLAAWTVAKQANGNIGVTINQLQNPAGLQSTLRADGLPVNVTFSGHSPSASCQPYPVSRDVMSAVFDYTSHRNVYLIINPSALPSGAGVAIFDRPAGGGPVAIPLPSGTSVPPGSVLGEGVSEFKISHGHVRQVLGLDVGLVHASQPCTG